MKFSVEGIVREDDVMRVEGYRRISTASSVSGYGTESERDPNHFYDNRGPHWRWSFRKSTL